MERSDTHRRIRRAPAQGWGAAIHAELRSDGQRREDDGHAALDVEREFELILQRAAAAGVTAVGAPPAADPALVALGRALFFDKIVSGKAK